jgi:hypothetical protein
VKKILDDDAEVFLLNNYILKEFVIKMWKMLIFELLKLEKGLTT